MSVGDRQCPKCGSWGPCGCSWPSIIEYEGQRPIIKTETDVEKRIQALEAAVDTLKSRVSALERHNQSDCDGSVRSREQQRREDAEPPEVPDWAMKHVVEPSFTAEDWYVYTHKLLYCPHCGGPVKV